MGKGLAVAAVALVLAVGSCGSTDQPSTSGHGSPASRSTSTSAPTTPAGLTFGPATSPVDPSGTRVVAIGGRVFGDDEHGLDQLWWDFAGGTPRCVAEYVSPPITDEQTKAVVEVKGDAFVRMRCSPVIALDLTRREQGAEASQRFDASGRFRLSGDRGSPTARNMVEVVVTGWGGGVLTVTVGLRHRAPLGIAWVGGDGPSATGEGDVQGAWLVVMQ